MIKIRYNINENKTYIKCDNKLKIIISFYEWNSFNNITKLLYETESFFYNNEIWYSFSKNLNELKGLKVVIKYDNIVKEEYFNFKEKKVSIFVDKELGLGDFMWSTPFIRKLSKLYNKKIDVYGYEHYGNYLKNNPYVDNFYNKKNYSLEYLNKNNDNFTIFDDFGAPYFYSDLRQLISKSAGMTLKEDELELDYIPDEYIDIDGLPNEYILINPRVDHKQRTFSFENWQKLVDKINDYGIPVVAIGVHPSKHFNELKIRNGLNLIYDERQNDLSQTWHIINKSKVFVTFDTGMYIFAGTTDTQILLNGWNCDPWFHQPYRKGSRNYKFSTVRGSCDIYCTTDPRTNIKEFGTIKIMHTSNKCILNTNYSCIPNINQVINKLKEWIK